MLLRSIGFSAVLAGLCGCRIASEVADVEPPVSAMAVENSIAMQPELDSHSDPESPGAQPSSTTKQQTSETPESAIELTAFEQLEDKDDVPALFDTAEEALSSERIYNPEAEDSDKKSTEQENPAIAAETKPQALKTPDADANESIVDPANRILSLLLPSEAADTDGDELRLESVVASVHQSFPLLEVAQLENDVTDGKQLAAWGAFDTKIKAASENGPTGFYQTYRNSTGVVRPLYDGGEVFGGYRIGRGDFQPWYQERQTNDGGEFKAGLRVPLARNREIDARRAQLWRATYDQQRARPEVRAQLIRFVQDASYAYWKWIAAGHQYENGRRALRLAEQRNGQLKRRVEEGDEDPPVLQDNLRAVAKRESKLIDLKRKLDQAAIKLSLFSRASDGTPFIPGIEQLVNFPVAQEVSADIQAAAVQTALQQRPELVALDAMYRKASVDLAEAQNDFLPAIDAQLVGSQDVGAPTSKKRDKSQFELEAGLFVDVPIERRKARGKSHAAHAKMHQISAKKRFTEDKIATEVRYSLAAQQAAFERIGKTREARRLAEYMASIERRKFDLGQSDLLKVVLREAYAIDAAAGEIDAMLEYFNSRADVSAALANDWPIDGGNLNER